MTAHDADGDMSRDAAQRDVKEDKKTSRNQGSLLKRADGLCLFITEEKVSF